MAVISLMAWSIGEIIDIYRQFDWIEENGFEAVSFHVSAGLPGIWQGIPLIEFDDSKLTFLRKRLKAFKNVEVHAPFEYEFCKSDVDSFKQLSQICHWCVKLGVSVITIHSMEPENDDTINRALCKDQIVALSILVEGSGTRIGLELTSGFDILEEVNVPNVGITLDVGHMFQKDSKGRQPLSTYQTVGSVIRLLGKKLVHVHIHDYNGIADHIEPGTGNINFS